MQQKDMLFMQSKYKEKKMKVVKKIINIVLSFLLCLGIVGGFMIMLFSNTVLSKKYALNQLEKNGYYEKVQTDLKNGFEEYQYQSGFPNTVFQNLCSSDMIKRDIDLMINYLYGETSEMMNHSVTVEERITKNINEYLSENNIVLTQEQQDNVEQFKEIVVNVYENKISIVSNYIDQVANVIKKMAEVMKIFQMAVIGFVIFMIIVILIINFNCFSDFISTIAVSFLSGGILLELINWVIVKQIDIKNIVLLTQSLSDLIKEISYDVLAKFCWYGGIFIVIGVGAIIVSNYKKVREK